MTDGPVTDRPLAPSQLGYPPRAPAGWTPVLPRSPQAGTPRPQPNPDTCWCPDPGDPDEVAGETWAVDCPSHGEHARRKGEAE